MQGLLKQLWHILGFQRLDCQLKQRLFGLLHDPLELRSVVGLKRLLQHCGQAVELLRGGRLLELDRCEVGGQLLKVVFCHLRVSDIVVLLSLDALSRVLLYLLRE